MLISINRLHRTSMSIDLSVRDRKVDSIGLPSPRNPGTAFVVSPTRYQLSPPYIHLYFRKEQAQVILLYFGMEINPLDDHVAPLGREE